MKMNQEIQYYITEFSNNITYKRGTHMRATHTNDITRVSILYDKIKQLHIYKYNVYKNEEL